MKYKLVVFDLDGTILDTIDDLKNAVNHALSKFGFQERSLSEIRSFVGNGIHKLIERSMPQVEDESIINQVFEEFKSYYAVHCAEMTKPYDGICELLSELKQKGIKTAVVSNKADFGVKKLISVFFDHLFDAAIGERSGIRKKPHPDSVFEVISKLDSNCEESVYIGDSDVDIETAKNAGIDIISVTWGFRDRNFLIENGAKILADDVSELRIALGL